MTAPQLLLHLRMPPEQSPRDTALHDLDHVRYEELGRYVDQQVDMVGHDLHCGDLKPILVRYGLKHLFAVGIRAVLQHFSPVLRAPDDMVLERIHVSSTMC